jgi:hypothetical protein
VGDLDYWATYKSYEKLIKNSLLKQKEREKRKTEKIKKVET